MNAARNIAVSMFEADHTVLLQAMQIAFRDGVPHNRALGLEMESIGEGWAVLRLPFAEHVVGDAVRRIIHGGAVTTLIDATCGAAVFMKLQANIPIATLDLRIDYLRGSKPERDVYAHAECVKLGRNVAFVRATAYDENPLASPRTFRENLPDPVALAAGSFIISGRGQSALGPAFKSAHDALTVPGEPDDKSSK